MTPGAGSFTRRLLRFLVPCLAILFVPRPALAIANPFSLVFLASLGWQLVVALVLFLPLWGASASAWLASRSPWFRRAFALGSGALLLVGLHLAVPDLPGSASGPDGRERYASECRPLGLVANRLGLLPDDLLIDPRLPAQFAQYHVTGACNLDPARLRDDAAFRASLESAGGRVLLTAEFRLTLRALYNDLLDAGQAPERWGVFEAGALFFRLEPGASPPPEILDAPIEDPYRFLADNTTMAYRDFSDRLTVGAAYRLADANRFGQFLAFRGGPQVMAGWPLSILGNHPAWRERRQAFLAEPAAKDATWIEVVDGSVRPQIGNRRFPGGPAVILTGRVGADLAAIDRLAGGRVRRALFLCDNAMSCPGAEALARDLLDRGDEVLGYVTAMSLLHRQFEALFARPPAAAPFPGMHGVLFVVATFVAVALCTGASRRLTRRLGVDAGGRRAAVSEWALRVLAAMGPAATGWGLVAIVSGIPQATRGLGGLYLLDAGRAGVPALSLLAVLTDLLLAAAILGARPRGRGRGLQVGYWLAAVLGFAAHVMLQVVSGLTVFEAGVLATVLAAPSVARWVGDAAGFARARWSSLGAGTPWRLVPLAAAAGARAAGGKAQWLGRAAASLPTVPPGVVLITTIEAFADGGGPAAQRLTRGLRRLGAGPRIVRSSAPGEDRAGSASSGRYASVRDVEPGLEARAVARVLQSYAREGVPADEPVGVVIQVQVAARLAGVASREALRRGGGILVEAAVGDTAAVTTGGDQSIHWGRIGAFSGRWVSGSLGEASIPASAFVDGFAVLERRFGGPVAIEWSFNGRQLVLLQVRPVGPEALEAADDGPPGFPALVPALSRRRFRGREIVLDSVPLADLQYGAARTTVALVASLYREGGRRLAVGGWLSRRMAEAGPEPAVVVIDGGVYLSLLPRRILAHLLLRPAAWWQRQAWRVAPGGPLARVAASVEDAAVRLRDAAQQPEPAEFDARAAWARCRRTLDLVTLRLAPDFLDAGLVASVFWGDEDPLGRTDPVLRALGRGPDGVQEIAERLPYRSVREWALEHPRLGEPAAGRSGMARAFAARDACFPQERSARGRAGRLLALARDNLSFGVALLRLDLAAVEAALGLPVGAVHRYDWSTIGTAAETGRALAPADPPVRPDPRLLPRFTLGHLERWVAGDRDAAPDSAAGFWVSGRGPIEGRVVDGDGPRAAPGEIPIRVVAHPEVREMASMPEGVVVVALAGNRLSHAAQVLRDRGIPALFGAEAFRAVVQPGRRVRLEPDGRIVGGDEEETR